MSILPDWLEEKAQQASGKANTKQTEMVQLPLWKDLERAIPNHLARSSLFAPIARGRRKLHDRVELASRRDVRIFYTGKQLDERDRDVFMQALHTAQQHPLGESTVINRAAFLRSIGRKTSGQEYKMLHESFERLWSGGLIIETKHYQIGNHPKSRAMHLLDSFDYLPEEGEYQLRIDPRMKMLFSNREFALVCWEKRFQISKQVDMAKWLQCLIATSDNKIQRYALDDLKERMQYASPMRKFREAIRAAFDELKRLHIVRRPRIETGKSGKEQIVFERVITL
ncbi:MAG: plasmid replication initiator TrfA [Thiolinea sp.]